MKYKKTLILGMSVSSILLLGNMNSYANTNNIQNANIEKSNYLSEDGMSRLGTASSQTVSKSVGGITYSGHTVISTIAGGKAKATSVVSTNKTAPSGYIGAHTAVYREGTGSAVSSSSWTYNKSSGTYIQANSSYGSAQKGQKFRAKGTMKSYNPSNGSYVGTSLNASPYSTYSLNSDDEFLSYKTMELTIPDKEVQERVEMYENKRMIAAEGLNGKEGYISLEDMGVYENPSSPEEAIKLQEERIQKYGDYKDINLYEKDGKTVIDTFRVWNK